MGVEIGVMVKILWGMVSGDIVGEGQRVGSDHTVRGELIMWE